MQTNTNDGNLNEYGRFDELKETIDKQKAKAYLEKIEGNELSAKDVNIKTATLLRNFIINGGGGVEF